jgi:hypothetical protein
MMRVQIIYFIFIGLKTKTLVGRHKHVHLRGVAVGNGALDFLTMNPSYAEYMYSRGFIPLAAKEHFDRQWAVCLDQLLYRAGASPITVSDSLTNSVVDIISVCLSLIHHSPFSHIMHDC